MNSFVFIIPMRNAHNTIEHTIKSLFAQTYESWRAIIIDDNSDDSSILISEAIINKYNNFYNTNKLQLIKNTNRLWEVENVFNALNMCDKSEIVCRLDADDWLTDNDGLTIINNVYDSTQCDVLWTMHRWNYTNQNISANLPDNVDPYKYAWVSSHLKTWRADLSFKVNPQNYFINNEFVKRAGDQAIYLPVLKLATRKIFLPLTLYHYSINITQDTFTSADAKFQKFEADYIRNRGFIY